MRKSPELIYAEALYTAADNVSAELVVDEFIKLLESRHQIHLLSKILTEFDRLCKRQKGLFEVKLTFPFAQSKELTDAVVNSLPSYGLFAEERIANADVSISLDSSLVGGFIAEADGKVLDVSIKRMLGEKYGA